MKTKIFLDSSDPLETQEMVALLGSLDGQTTNPTLVSRHPAIQSRLQEGRRFSKRELTDLYSEMIADIATHIPDGPISVEVYSDENTTAMDMVEEGRTISQWGPNIHVKLPTTLAGIEAANILSQTNVKLNMTLVFTQNQAAAAYKATGIANQGDVLVSPFVGRLDDVGQSGLSLVKNIQEMYKSGDGHVQVVMASVRDIETFIWGIENGVDIISAPSRVLRAWTEAGKPENLSQEQKDMLAQKGEDLKFVFIDLSHNAHSFALSHELTEVGVKRFAEDWNNLLNI